jgi:hypothetical protein
MLFASSGLTDAPWAPRPVAFRPLNFWSGGITAPLDVAFLHASAPLPDAALVPGRKPGALDVALRARNSFWCGAADVRRLDPFAPPGDTSSGSSNNSGDEERVHSAECPPASLAPLFVLELPGGTIANMLNEPAANATPAQAEAGLRARDVSRSLRLVLSLGATMAAEVDTKLLALSGTSRSRGNAPKCCSAARRTCARGAARRSTRGATRTRRFSC